MKRMMFLLVTLLALMVESACAQTGVVTGKVVDGDTKTPIAGVEVAALSGKKVVVTTQSAADGRYTLSLDAGTYTIKFTHPDYVDYLRKWIKVTAGQRTVVNATLEPQIYDLEICEELEIVADDVAFFCDASYSAPVMTKQAVGAVADYAYIQQHNTESYDVVNENRFLDAITNPLSTFSIDVDRASYSNVRRYLKQNQKPVKDAVRIEELVNYFDYSYPQPKKGEPFSVTVEVDSCPWNPSRKLALIGLKGENVSESVIPPSNLVFLIDVSGSMDSHNKLPLLKQSFKFLTDNLRPQDRVAIVVYAGAAGLVLESTPGTQKQKIIDALDNLNAGGSTAGGAGIKLAYAIAKQNFISNGNNRVILATDGDFNVGASSDAEMVRLIEDKRNDGVFLTILGFGMGNYKDSKMEKLSNAGNGNYGYIDDLLEAKKMFGAELWGTLYTIAKDVKIQVEFNPAQVKSYRLIGYENRMLNTEDFNDDKKDAGEIGCGHTVTALYEIIPAESEEHAPNVDPLEYQTTRVGTSPNLMTVKVRYKNPKEDDSRLLEYRILERKATPSNNIRFASSVAEFGMLLRESEYKGSASFSAVIARAKQSAENDKYGYKADFVKMVELCQMMYR
ncbi:MAG: von Willebrand factor type A domain-containing protein [Bacteroidales bacterium]|nr:von Willebrand factor type A domain-containing protein [Bacteroidales bacterium]MBN2748127.1 von Willebrand factor type A domain-containing protein [Bacteroidales bacterium]